MSFKPILYVLLLAALSSCQRNEITFELQGRVKGESGSGLSGVEVSLSQQKVESGALNTSSEFVQSTSTGMDGRFNFSFERENVLIYILELDKQGYFSKEIELEFDRFSPESATCQDAILYERAELEVRLENVNPIDNFDNIRYRNLNAIFDCPCCDNTPQEFGGQNVDTTFTCSLYGDYWLRYEYEIEKDGATTLGIDSMFIQPAQVNLIHIEY